MPESSPAKLRIYCICGQKMRVSATMLGRPGKCVACRQKIRIPRLDELPGDGSGYYEIYLKDHLEFLRKAVPEESGAARARRDDDARGEEQEDLPLGDPSDKTEWIPLDVLEPLRILCSFEYDVERRLEALRQDRRLSDGMDKPMLLSYRAAARNARGALEEQLRQRLYEVMDQIAGLAEQIARVTLGFRIGEMDYESFRKAVLVLRERRERLERRRANLRGWLSVSDPYMAGGYTAVTLETLPPENVEVTFPLEPKLSGTLVDYFIERLREALKAREQAERKLNERKRMEHEGGLSGAELEDCQANALAERERAWAGVLFCRERLEQMVRDCESDIKAARAHLEAARGRFDAGDYDLQAFQQLELSLLRAQSDFTKARDLARRALVADSGAAVPRPEGTFLKRIGQLDAGPSIGVDSWIAWFAATLIILNIVTPISKAQDSGNMAVAQGMVTGLFVAAALLAAFACIPRRDLRGVLITGHWLISALVGAYHIQRAWHSPGIIGTEMRADPGWFSGPGILLFLAWIAVMGIAALVSLAPFTRMRYLPVGIGLAIALIIGGALTDFGGVFAPDPALEVSGITLTSSAPPEYNVIVQVENRGVFRRSLWLGGRGYQTPYPALLVLERRIGSDSWEDAGLPAMMRREQQAWDDVRYWSAFPSLAIHAGNRFIFQYHLKPGAYRAQLILTPWRTEQLRREFVLEPPTQADAPQEMALPEAPKEQAAEGSPEYDETHDAPVFSEAPRTGVHMELRGLINAADRTPRFSVYLYAADGTVTQKRVSLGEEIYPPWRAAEYNPSLKTLTVSDGARMLIIQAGEALFLEVTP